MYLKFKLEICSHEYSDYGFTALQILQNLS